jgi:hypothetical protein
MEQRALLLDQRRRGAGRVSWRDERLAGRVGSACVEHQSQNSQQKQGADAQRDGDEHAGPLTAARAALSDLQGLLNLHVAEVAVVLAVLQDGVLDPLGELARLDRRLRPQRRAERCQCIQSPRCR